MGNKIRYNDVKDLVMYNDKILRHIISLEAPINVNFAMQGGLPGTFLVILVDPIVIGMRTYRRLGHKKFNKFRLNNLLKLVKKGILPIDDILSEINTLYNNPILTDNYICNYMKEVRRYLNWIRKELLKFDNYNIKYLPKIDISFKEVEEYLDFESIYGKLKNLNDKLIEEFGVGDIAENSEVEFFKNLKVGVNGNELKVKTRVNLDKFYRWLEKQEKKNVCIILRHEMIKSSLINNICYSYIIELNYQLRSNNLRKAEESIKRVLPIFFKLIEDSIEFYKYYIPKDYFNPTFLEINYVYDFLSLKIFKKLIKILYNYTAILKVRNKIEASLELIKELKRLCLILIKYFWNKIGSWTNWEKWKIWTDWEDWDNLEDWDEKKLEYILESSFNFLVIDFKNIAELYLLFLVEESVLKSELGLKEDQDKTFKNYDSILNEIKRMIFALNERNYYDITDFLIERFMYFIPLSLRFYIYVKNFNIFKTYKYIFQIYSKYCSEMLSFNFIYNFLVFPKLKREKFWFEPYFKFIFEYFIYKLESPPNICDIFRYLFENLEDFESEYIRLLIKFMYSVLTFNDIKGILDELVESEYKDKFDFCEIGLFIFYWIRKNRRLELIEGLMDFYNKIDKFITGEYAGIKKYKFGGMIYELARVLAEYGLEPRQIYDHIIEILEEYRIKTSDKYLNSLYLCSTVPYGLKLADKKGLIGKKCSFFLEILANNWDILIAICNKFIDSIFIPLNIKISDLEYMIRKNKLRTYIGMVCPNKSENLLLGVEETNVLDKFFRSELKKYRVILKKLKRHINKYNEKKYRLKEDYKDMYSLLKDEPLIGYKKIISITEIDEDIFSIYEVRENIDEIFRRYKIFYEKLVEFLEKYELLDDIELVKENYKKFETYYNNYKNELKKY